MRQWMSLALATALAVSAGCQEVPRPSAEEPRFATASGLIELRFPAGWKVADEKNPFDLQCFSKDKRMMTAVFEFNRSDLAAHLTPRAVFESQIEDMRSKRKNFVVVEEETTARDPERALTSIVYAGEKGDARNYYRFTLVELTARPEIFAVALQTALPSEWASSRRVLADITRTVALGKGRTSPQ